ncbi:MAG: tetratricopeptide repeat protein [Treponema sp.]|nr:tetratricopeptide repeat protein [Treponema sp.]
MSLYELCEKKLSGKGEKRGVQAAPVQDDLPGSITALLMQGTIKSTFDMGTISFNNGQFDDAINYFTYVIKYSPGHELAHMLRGCAYQEKGDFDTAIADLNTAVKINPNNFYSYFSRGNSYYHKRDKDHAVSDYETALRLKPGDEKATSNLKLARTMQG